MLTVKHIASSVANDIRTYGHYQVGHGKSLNLTTGPICLVVNPTMSRFDEVLGTIHSDTLLYDELRVAIAQHYGQTLSEFGDLAMWSDVTPTDEVLSVLDSIAGKGK